MESMMKEMHSYGARKPVRHWLRTTLFAAMLATAGFAQEGAAAQTYTLQALTDAALQQNPAMRTIAAREESARAAVTTATALINPEVEAGLGPTRNRAGGHEINTNWGIGLSQPLEFSAVREARRGVAESGVTLASANAELTRSELRNRVRAAYYDVLQRQAVLRLVEEDRALLAEIRDKVRLRVNLGEAPRYELIKAETESLAAERDYRSAQVRIEEAKTQLRGLVGSSIPADFDVSGELPGAARLLALAELQQRIDQSPFMRQGRLLNESAQARLKLEERLRNPGLTLKAGVEQDPDLTSVRFGVAIPIPLWNKRQGPIAEAAAGVREAEAVLDERELSLKRGLEAAYQRYQIARQQVETFESGLLAQAQSTLRVAESAYRYGERGILDYLDAQRTYRAVRKDHIAARYELVSTALEIERLLGTELLEE
jgi:cobalt-zinc-cadmium efflux system outer membrane protein